MGVQVVYVSAAGALAVSGERRGAPCVIVADFAEEACTPVQVPPAGWRDRHLLLERRLAHECADTPFRAALPLSGPHQPHGWTHVLVSLPAATLQQLLEEWAASGQEVVGVWTTALAAAWWLKQARMAVARGLVVLRTPSGVRHILLAGGLPVVSRLVAEAIDGEERLDQARELERTVQYLRNARWLAPDEAIPAWNWGLPPEQFPPSLARGALRWQPAPRLSGLPDPGEQGAAAVFALMARRQPRMQLAPPALLAVRRARRFARMLVSGSAVAGGALAVAGAMLVQAAVGLHQQRAGLALDKQRAQAEVAQAMAVLQRANVPPKTLAAALALHGRLTETRALEMADAFRLLAAQIADLRTLRLDEIEWTQPPTAEQAAACGAAGAADTKALLRIAGHSSAAAPRPEVVEEGRRLHRRLAAQPKAAVHALRAPFAVEREPLRAEGDVAQPQPFAFCLRFLEAAS
ncbi:MAG: hypothetical protein NZL99_07865 [Burkholderiaceae bacterium]|nr:hypothetical protein [Burkholderiaceae bacterium]MCX8003763.1 hypothetical protein [Burkholderiaceae bacterium]